MSENVFYKKFRRNRVYVAPELSVGGIAHTVETPESITMYFPDRGLEASGILNVLPVEYDLGEPDERRAKTLLLTKETLEGPTSSWLVYRITSVPADARMMQVEKSRIDRLADVFSRHERELAEFAKEVDAISASKSERAFTFTTKSDPFKYQKELDMLCEEILLKEIFPKAKRKHLNTNNSIKTSRESKRIRGENHAGCEDKALGQEPAAA